MYEKQKRSREILNLIVLPVASCCGSCLWKCSTYFSFCGHEPWVRMFFLRLNVSPMSLNPSTARHWRGAQRGTTLPKSWIFTECGDTNSSKWDRSGQKGALARPAEAFWVDCLPSSITWRNWRRKSVRRQTSETVWSMRETKTKCLPNFS